MLEAYAITPRQQPGMLLFEKLGPCHLKAWQGQECHLRPCHSEPPDQFKTGIDVPTQNETRSDVEGRLRSLDQFDVGIVG